MKRYLEETTLAIIKPFRAMRFSLSKAGRIETLTCPPYDIISDSEREEYLRTNPCNIIRLELPKGENPYKTAGDTLKEWLSNGILREDHLPGLYLYEEEFEIAGERKSFRGVICRVKLSPFSEGIVLPHENTLSKAKEDRFALMQATGCNFSCVYSLYLDEQHTTEEKLSRLCADSPNIEMNDGEVTHRLWIVNDPIVIDSICSDFASRQLFIADGHHRYETALRYRDWCRENGLALDDSCDSVMMMLVDMQSSGLVVFPTHRLLHDLENFSASEVLEKCSEYFDIDPALALGEAEKTLDKYYRREIPAFALYCGGETCALLSLRDRSAMDLFPEDAPCIRSLDVFVLHRLILERILGIDRENMANGVNLSYTRSKDEAIAAVRSGEIQAAFLLNPTKIREIRDVAAAGEKMPQKSTYFYPKLITGLVMNRMNVKLPEE